MIIAVATEKGNVSGHFGYCEGFTLCKTENNAIMSSKLIANPGHKPGFLPNYLSDLDVKVIVAGGMGGKAVEIFNSKNIEVVTGATGEVELAVKQYLTGELKSTGSVCHEHEHESDACHTS